MREGGGKSRERRRRRRRRSQTEEDCLQTRQVHVGHHSRRSSDLSTYSIVHFKSNKLGQLPQYIATDDSSFLANFAASETQRKRT